MTEDKGILIKNIFYMLSYAYQVLKQSNYEKIAAESFDNINDLFSAILAQGMIQQGKQGLYREYISFNENLLTLKGKLDLNGSIYNKIHQIQKLSCEYDGLSENNQFNQILKSTAAYLLKQNDVSEKNKNLLRQALCGFATVDQIAFKNITWSKLTYQRNNQSYRMLLYLCYFVISRDILTTSSGEYKMRKFTEEHMSALYEKFVLNYYNTHHPYLHPSAKQISFDLRESISEEASEFLPKMKSDIYLSFEGKVLIIDTKYYKNIWQVYDREDPESSQTIRNAHIYQIMSYVNNTDKNHTGNVIGTLLYAQTGNKRFDLDYPNINGNRYCVKTLDLNVDFEHLKKQLDELIINIFGLSTSD